MPSQVRVMNTPGSVCMSSKRRNIHGQSEDSHQAQGVRALDHRPERRSHRGDRQARLSGPIPLPTEKEIITILRSPHKHKDSREQFEQRTHKRLIDILDPNPRTVDALTKLDLPAGVEIEIKL